MSTFKIPENTYPVTVKKPPVKVSSPSQAPQKSLQTMTSALPPAKPTAAPEVLETQFEPGIPDDRWSPNQSSPAQFTAADLLVGDREIWAKGVILGMILGKPRCKSRGWR
jgi:hypothetical protein